MAIIIFVGSFLTFLAARAREVSDLHKAMGALRDVVGKRPTVEPKSGDASTPAIHIPTQREIDELGNLRFFRRTKMVARVTNLSLALALGSGFFMAGKWATDRFNAEAKNVETKGPGKFQPPN